MRYLSLFSGVEAATLAWSKLGWEAVAFSEIEPFPCAVLNYHWPRVPNLGDVRKITASTLKKLGKIDLIVFGSPCQGLSMAGLMEGLNDERSGLFKEAIRIINLCKKHCGTRFALWENVPGAFSTNRGSDFAEVINLLSGSKFDCEKWETSGVAIGQKGLVEWATLDAQHFGVPQRRRRVFALADFGNWQDRGQVLFEPESLSRDFEASFEAGQEATFKTSSCIRASSHWDNDLAPHPTLNQSNNTGGIALSNQELFSQRGAGLVSSSIYNKSGGHIGGGSENLILPANLYEFIPTLAYCLQTTSNDYSRADGFNMVVHGTQDPIKSDKAHCPGRNNGSENVLAFIPNEGHHNQKVRKLTPIECERLQGMPDNHTQIPWNDKPKSSCVDGERYKAIGNSMCVFVMRWIGRQIQESLCSKTYMNYRRKAC